MDYGPIAFSIGLLTALGAFQAHDANASGAPAAECISEFESIRQIRDATRVPSEFRALDLLGHPTIAINSATGKIEWMTPKARQLLEGSFGAIEDPTSVPSDIQIWLNRVLPEPPSQTRFQPEPVLRSQKESSELRLQVRGRLPEDQIVLIGVSEFSLPKLLKDISEKYGLTPREAEVFYWIAQGKTNNDIGLIIGASGGTAKKHVENIFRKLGLSNRTQPGQMLRRDFNQ